MKGREKLRVLVVEDDDLIRASFRHLLKEQNAEFFSDSASLLASGRSDACDLLLLDLCSPQDPYGQGTIERIPEIRARYSESEVVVQSGLSDVDSMRACLRAGAGKFILKEHLAEEVPLLVERLIELKSQRDSLEKEILGNSPVVRRLRTELLTLKFESVDVLIEGETGSGKELCARALHPSGEGAGPFIALNVSAIPPELFESEFFGAERGAFSGATQTRGGHLESAGAGTLFLDEIQSLAPAHQAKLLRVLETRVFTRVGSSQERPFHARVVSASNQKLREAVAKGVFREDLYYRIAPITVAVPPLRVRGRDIALLAETFLRDLDPTRTKRFTPAGLDYLVESYDWPGNVRELRGIVRGLAIRSPMPLIDAPELREIIGREENKMAAGAAEEVAETRFETNWSASFDENVERFEKHLLQQTLRKHSSADAREKLKLARSRFYEKVRQYGLLK